MDFTQKAIVAAKRTEPKYHHPIEITTTGHSLGGTLAEITAYRFKLGGESFNSYGAVGLQYGIPEKVPAGYPGFTNHVRATDVVSAGSAYYGEVKTYARLPRRCDAGLQGVVLRLGAAWANDHGTAHTAAGKY